MIIGEAHRGQGHVVAPVIANAFAQDDSEGARLQWRQVAGQLGPKVAKLAALMWMRPKSKHPAYFVAILSRSDRVTPARPRCFRRFGQAKVTLDLG